MTVMSKRQHWTMKLSEESPSSRCSQDDVLLEQLVLKGGNAMALVYGFGSRASLDVDMSIDGSIARISSNNYLIKSASRSGSRQLKRLPVCHDGWPTDTVPFPQRIAM